MANSSPKNELTDAGCGCSAVSCAGLCLCGCGRQVKTPGRKYSIGHHPNQRGKQIKAFNEKKSAPGPERERWIKGISQSYARGRRPSTIDLKKHGEMSRKWQRAMGQDHHEASEWRLVSPDGELFFFKNLYHFVRENPERFTPEDVEMRGEKLSWCRAVNGLQKLNPKLKHPIPQWKGWSWCEYHTNTQLDHP